MIPSMAIARARTMLSEALRPFDRGGERAWSAVRPKLQLSREMASARRRERLARNILRAALARPVRYLEIGSFEGGSLAFVHSLLGSQVAATSIDPFQDYDELRAHKMVSVEERFRSNMRSAGIDVRILRGLWVLRLPQLLSDGEAFDLIYIDGSHVALDVMTDAVLCWRLLASGGLMVFDDYRDFECRPAIDAFVRLVEARVVDVASQVFLRKQPTGREASDWEDCFCICTRTLIDGSRAGGLLMRRRASDGHRQYRRMTDEEEAEYGKSTRW